MTDSATSFQTSSDYRLKENVDYTWDATTRLKQLKPARFNNSSLCSANRPLLGIPIRKFAIFHRLVVVTPPFKQRILTKVHDFSMPLDSVSQINLRICQNKLKGE